MKMMFNLIGAFLFFYTVSPVFMYYIYENNPISGFAAVKNRRIDSYLKTGLSGIQRKYFSGYTNKNQKFDKDFIVDSQFKVRKTSPNTFTSPQAEIRKVTQEMPVNTEPPMRWQQQRDKKNTFRTGQDPRVNVVDEKLDHAEKNSNENNKVSKTYEQSQNNAKSAPYHTNSRQVNNNNNQIIQHPVQGNREKLYEGKPNYVQVNVRKTQITADPQRVFGNRQPVAVAVNRPQPNQRTSKLVDAKFQKATTFSDRNAQIMARVLDDISNHISNNKRDQANRWNKKRDTESFKAAKRYKDSMKKYIGKEKNNRNNLEVARVGSREASLEFDTPSAVFYRMGPETLDRQEGFILMGSMEDSANNIYSAKQKRLSVNYENEIDLKKIKSKKNSNTWKQHKVMKNFANYRSH